ncbi:MAG: leucine-rich repeat protein [Clostridia bacterium]|nr:leucine-rich repeat protein [Clostridia bacterium]
MLDFLKKNKNEIKAAVLKNALVCEGLSLREICEITNTPLPKRFNKVADIKNPRLISGTAKVVKKGDIYVGTLRREGERFISMVENASAKEPLAMIMPKSDFDACQLKEEDYPVILVENIEKFVETLCQHYRSLFDGKVVSFTGSVGKTTTNALCKAAVSYDYRALGHRGNENGYFQILQNIQKFMKNSGKLKPSMYFQEIGASTPGSVRLGAEFLRPDVFLFTNIKEHGLNAYGTIENLLEDKASIDHFLSDDGLVITNFDDERLRAHKFEHRVVSIGVDSEDVDYRAVNIEQKGVFLECDIVFLGKSQHLKMNVLGNHNAYNMAMAFALALEMGVSPENAAKGIADYRPSGIRQNFSKINDFYLMMDCYNVAEDSMISMLESQMAFNNRGRKIAVLGAENGLGEIADAKTLELGHKIAEFDLDEIIFFGTDSQEYDDLQRFGNGKLLMEAFQEKNSKTKCSFMWKHEELGEYLKEIVKPEDSLFVKTITHLQTSFAIDYAFGTQFAYGAHKSLSRHNKADGYTYMTSAFSPYGILEDAPVVNGQVKIPAEIEGVAIYAIADGAFKNKKDIKKVEIEEGLVNIGKNAFKGCANLVECSIPESVQLIGEGAFEGSKVEHE